MRLFNSVTLLLLLASCRNDNVQTKDFDKEAESNGVSIRARFIDGNTRKNLNTGNVSLVTHKQFSGEDTYMYFDIQIERPGFEPDKKTAEYLDFGMNNDFSIRSGTDSMRASLVHRLANGRKDVYEYVVAFRRPGPHENEKGVVAIVYDDKLFGLGRQVFEFRKQDILKAIDKTN